MNRPLVRFQVPVTTKRNSPFVFAGTAGLDLDSVHTAQHGNDQTVRALDMAEVLNVL